MNSRNWSHPYLQAAEQLPTRWTLVVCPATTWQAIRRLRTSTLTGLWAWTHREPTAPRCTSGRWGPGFSSSNYHYSKPVQRVFFNNFSHPIWRTSGAHRYSELLGYVGLVESHDDFQSCSIGDRRKHFCVRLYSTNRRKSCSVWWNYQCSNLDISEQRRQAVGFTARLWPPSSGSTGAVPRVTQ